MASALRSLAIKQVRGLDALNRLIVARTRKGSLGQCGLIFAEHRADEQPL
jgi:hypothetical protein